MNLNELKEWVKKEQDAGESNDDIRKILAQNTGWSEDELNNVFSELNTSTAKEVPVQDDAALINEKKS